MKFYFVNIAGGVILGALLAWILMLWVNVFVTQTYDTTPENSPHYSLESKSIN